VFAAQFKEPADVGGAPDPHSGGAMNGVNGRTGGEGGYLVLK
jgi:hypothetical protein